MSRTVGFIFLVIALSSPPILAQSLVGAPRGPVNNGDVVELRTMLRQALDQNKRLEQQNLRLKLRQKRLERLEQQNLRLKLIWTGLQQMCSAINLAPCDCPLDPSALKTTPITPIKPPPTPLRVKHIRSEGVVGSGLPLAVTYTAPDSHTTEWLVLRKNGGMMRTSGSRSKVLAAGGEPQFTSNLNIADFSNTTSQVLFRMYTEDQSASVRFNLTTLEDKAEMVLVEPETKTLKLNSSYEAPLDSDLNITVVLPGNVKQNEYALSGEAFLTSLNTTSYPPSIFEIHAFNGDEINLSLRPIDDNNTAMVLTLKYPYVQYGGILTVRQLQNAGGFIESFSYGTSVRILSPVTKEVVPYNSVGVYPLPRYTNVFPPSQSIICAAMGNPRPEVYILQVNPAGFPEEIRAETVVSDSVTNMKVYNIQANTPAAMGKYICRAVSGNKTVDSMTEARLIQTAVFDGSHTGITRNTSSEIIVSCQASGVPRPKLGLRLYYNFGPDVTTTGMYKVARIEPDANTSRVMLVLRPTDVAVHTLYCVANQERVGGDKFRKITIFPENVRQDNWRLFDRLQELERAKATP